MLRASIRPEEAEKNVTAARARLDRPEDRGVRCFVQAGGLVRSRLSKSDERRP